MEAKIQKWGNSLGIRIPMAMLKDLSLKSGSIVEIEKVNANIIIHPTEKSDALTMISEITEDNIHSEFDWGQSEGDENW